MLQKEKVAKNAKPIEWNLMIHIWKLHIVQSSNWKVYT
jgi:hypothetical protein